MGLELSEDVIRENMPEYLPENQAALLPRPSVSILIYFLTSQIWLTRSKVLQFGIYFTWIDFSRLVQYWDH